MTSDQLTPEMKAKFEETIAVRNKESNELLDTIKHFGFKHTGLLPCISCPDEFRSYKYVHVKSDEINITLLPGKKEKQFILVIPGIIKHPSVQNMNDMMNVLAKHFDTDGSIIRQH